MASFRDSPLSEIGSEGKRGLKGNEKPVDDLLLAEQPSDQNKMELELRRIQCARGESHIENLNSPARSDVSFLQGELMELDWSCGDLAEGMRLYEAGEFFAAHESWELVWLRTPQPEKAFLQGLIQVTAAFHHLQRGNLKGAQLLLQAALMRLDSLPDNFGGICVAPLRDDIRSRLGELEAKSACIEWVAIPRIPI